MGGGSDDNQTKELSKEEMQRIIDEAEAEMIADEEAKSFPDWKPGERKRALIKTFSQEEFERELMPEKYADKPIWLW